MRTMKVAGLGQLSPFEAASGVTGAAGLGAFIGNLSLGSGSAFEDKWHRFTGEQEDYTRTGAAVGGLLGLAALAHPKSRGALAEMAESWDAADI